jgi:hypothetical protein
MVQCFTDFYTQGVTLKVYPGKLAYFQLPLAQVEHQSLYKDRLVIPYVNKQCHSWGRASCVEMMSLGAS